MKFLKQHRLAVGILYAVFCARIANADTITAVENSTIGDFGPGATSAYGQTLTATTNDSFLNSFTFTDLHSVNNLSFNYQTYIYAYNPGTNMETGAALYTSGIMTVPATGNVMDQITPHLALVPGQTYIVVISPSSDVQTNPGATAVQGITSPATYTGGGFVFNNDPAVNGFEASPFTTFYINDDAAFIAVFGPATFNTFGLDANQQATLGPINNQIVAGLGTPGFTALVNALLPLSGNPSTFGAALNQLSPLAFQQFTSETAFNNASYETEEMDNYLAGERDKHGNFLASHGGIDSSGLTVNDPSYDPNLAMVHSRLLAWNPAPYGGTVSDIGGPLLGGVDMKDEKNMTSVSGPAYTDPWNFFVRGNVILAQGFSGADVSHFDDNTESVVLGTDYRVTNHFLVGLKAGYAHTDVTLDNNGSSATVDSYSPGFYASYADKGWYANLLGDYVHNAYTQNRVIGFLGQTATSAPEGNEGVADLDGGYDFHMGAFTLGPLTGVQYTHLSVDGYTESGSIADLSVDDSESDSLRSRLGGRISYTFSDCGINFTPHLDASWQHEFLDQSRGITSQFGFGGGSFAVRTENPSRDSALVDAGIDANLNRTVTLFTDYIAQAGQDNYFGQSVQAGLKIGF